MYIYISSLANDIEAKFYVDVEKFFALEVVV